MQTGLPLSPTVPVPERVPQPEQGAGNTYYPSTHIQHSPGPGTSGHIVVSLPGSL